MFEERHVTCRFEDGRLVPNDSGYWVSVSESGLLVSIVSEAYPQGIDISRFAWKGIVAAVAEIQAEREKRASENVTLSALIDGEP